MKIPAFLTIVVLCVGVPLVAVSSVTGYEPEGFDELDKQKGTFKTTLVRPDADFSRYTKIQPRAVALEIHNPAGANDFSTGRLLAKRAKESIVPEYDEVVEFKRIVGDVLVAEISENTDLEVVDSAGPDTLILQPVITEAVFSSSSKNKSEDGRELPELEQGVIVFDLLDGETGTIVARFEEKRRSKPPKGTEKTTGLWPNLESWAERAAVDLLHELQRFEGSGRKNS
jgi:hypothetical protein